jgi:hypothetical protein
VDVFSKQPYSGNGLTIFIDTPDLEKSRMQTITQEMRQFESIFLRETDANAFRITKGGSILRKMKVTWKRLLKQSVFATG